MFSPYPTLLSEGTSVVHEIAAPVCVIPEDEGPDVMRIVGAVAVVNSTSPEYTRLYPAAPELTRAW